MRNILNTKHIVETNTTYWEHLTHSLEHGLWGLFFTLTCIIDFFYQSKKIKKKRSYILKLMYDDLIKRWNIKEYGDDDERKKQREYYREVIKNIEQGVIRRYTKFEWMQGFFILFYSSLIHGFFPEILVDHAAKLALTMYLNQKNFPLD